VQPQAQNLTVQRKNARISLGEREMLHDFRDFYFSLTFWNAEKTFSISRSLIKETWRGNERKITRVFRLSELNLLARLIR